MVSNQGGGWRQGMPNAWQLTLLGQELQAAIETQAALGGAR